MKNVPFLWTHAKLADHLGRPIHDIRATLKTLGVQPLCRADRIAVYDNDVMRLLRHEFKRIDVIRKRTTKQASAGESHD